MSLLMLEVGKLAATTSMGHNHEHFLQLVSNISKNQHYNIVKLIGYRAAYSQRLLVYECCINGTLHDALHGDDEHHTKPSWNVHMRVALGATKASE